MRLFGRADATEWEGSADPPERCFGPVEASLFLNWCIKTYGDKIDDRTHFTVPVTDGSSHGEDTYTRLANTHAMVHPDQFMAWANQLEKFTPDQATKMAKYRLGLEKGERTN